MVTKEVCSPRQKTFGMTKRLRYSDIPSWLQDSAFYLNLSAEEADGTINIPIDCFRATDDHVETCRDLAEILTVMRYWGLPVIPHSVLEFCYSNDSFSWINTVADVFGENSCEYFSLVTNFQHLPQFPLEGALMIRRPEFVTFWLAKVESSSKQGENAIAHACRYGRLDLVQTLHESGFLWDGWAYCAAAQYGHLDILQYLHDKDCPLDANAMVFATRGGQLKCMQYLHLIGCPWSRDVLNEFAVPAHYAFLSANTSTEAVWTDDFTIGPPVHGYVECLQYALENACPATCEACNIACQYGLVDCLHLLYERRICFDVSAMNVAASHGQLQCLKFLEEIGCYGLQDVCADAARNGHLPCLQFLHEQNFTWNETTVYAAAENGHLECLQYAIEHNCDFNAQVALDHAIKSQSDACIKYLLGKQQPI